MKVEYLKISERENGAEITVLRDCSVRWSEDKCIWTTLGEFRAGDVVRDDYTRFASELLGRRRWFCGGDVLRLRLCPGVR